MITKYGALLRELRKIENETQSQMAYRLGVSSSLLSSVEHGNANIPRYLTTRILKEYLTVLNKEQRQALLRAEINQKRIRFRRPYKKLRIKVTELIEQVRLWQENNLLDLHQLNKTIKEVEELIK